MFELWVLVVIAVLGLVAGVLGGLLGVGGSTIMIPGLVLLFGQGREVPGLAGGFEGLNQHLYQAAAMVVNVFVSVPATVRHVQAGAVVWKVIKLLAVPALVAILVGVWVSNLDVFSGSGGPVLLGRLLAVFLVYVIYVNVKRLFVKPRPVDEPLDLSRVTVGRTTVVGGAMGMVAGLLGIGGGSVAVPLQQVILRLRLRNCIANSAAVICLTAGVGALYKTATLGGHGLRWQDGLIVAGLLIPTAMVGGWIGGRLTHVLPVRVVRAVFVVILVVAAWKMAAI